MSGSNYPDSTWAGDPHAPWNEPDPWVGRTCEDCDYIAWVTSESLEHVCVWPVVGDGEHEVDPVGITRPACEWFEARS